MTDHTPEKPRRTTRRRVLKTLGAFGLAGVGTGAALGPGRNGYYSGPVSDHFDGERFFNPGGRGPKGFLHLVRWSVGTRAEGWPSEALSPFSDTPPPRVNGPGVRIAYIGHASFLIQTSGLNILFDPVYAERVSPVSFAGPRRINAPGVPFDRIPKIDWVLITHNHYDHLDTAFLARLWQRDQPRLLTPLGNDTIIKAAVPGMDLLSRDWGDVVDLSTSVRAHVVPTQHWSARGARDRMHALWASFVLTTVAAGTEPGRTVYAIGDTGYGDGRTFRHVAGLHPSIDLALLPIGAYEPRWFMRDQHMNPAEAVAVFQTVKAKRAGGHHWGTFRLTNEGHERPREHLAAALAAAGIGQDAFRALQPGEVMEV